MAEEQRIQDIRGCDRRDEWSATGSEVAPSANVPVPSDAHRPQVPHARPGERGVSGTDGVGERYYYDG